MADSRRTLHDLKENFDWGALTTSTISAQEEAIRIYAVLSALILHLAIVLEIAEDAANDLAASGIDARRMQDLLGQMRGIVGERSAELRARIDAEKAEDANG